jgi:hypothetical protein
MTNAIKPQPGRTAGITAVIATNAAAIAAGSLSLEAIAGVSVVSGLGVIGIVIRDVLR